MLCEHFEPDFARLEGQMEVVGFLYYLLLTPVQSQSFPNQDVFAKLQKTCSTAQAEAL